MSKVKMQAQGHDGLTYRIMDDAPRSIWPAGIYSIEVAKVYGDSTVWILVYDGGTDYKATVQEFNRLISGDKEKALEVVKEYFGGYMPESLKEEGMGFRDDAGLYALVEKIEVYYMNEHNDADFGGREDSVHSYITEIVKGLNK